MTTIKTICGKLTEMFANNTKVTVTHSTSDTIGEYKDYFMDYLAIEESTKLHKNKNESNYTTPYGIYKEANRHTELIRYVDYISRIQNLNLLTTSGRLKFNRILMSDEAMRSKIYDLVWDIYETKYIKEKIFNLLGKKTKLVYFSISVNGGPTRATKLLQKSLGVKSDGKFGPASMKALRSTLKSDETLATNMIHHMRKYYAYLIRINPKKYKININGWENRILRLEKYIKNK